MKFLACRLSVHVLALAALLALAESAYGHQPPDVVASDSKQNTAMGTNALFTLGSGYADTASGFQALFSNTSGYFNSASGADALFKNTTGYANTASGAETLYSNTTGDGNSGCGMEVLFYNTSGSNNSGMGYNALYYNTTGAGNTASGMNALFHSTTGTYNTASGMQALYQNTTGIQNTASGFNALYANTTGDSNTAFGVNALNDNSDGMNNTASGRGALQSNTTGSNNIAQGYEAGFSLTTGSNNIDIGNKGVAAESGTIRIGTSSVQDMTYIAGIYGTAVSGSAVMISSTGKLGSVVSSERYKTAIVPMGANTTKLEQLRPVTFHLKTDPHGTLQYGLIAEEVAKVYPELVIRNESGQIDGVRYDELAPILLNAVQQQAAQIRDFRQELAHLRTLNHETQLALLKLQSHEDIVAKR